MPHQPPDDTDDDTDDETADNDNSPAANTEPDSTDSIPVSGDAPTSIASENPRPSADPDPNADLSTLDGDAAVPDPSDDDGDDDSTDSEAASIPESMPATATPTPSCDYLKQHDELEGALRPKIGPTAPRDIKCQRDAVITYRDDEGTMCAACEYHAPSDFLNALDIPIPDDRDVEGRYVI